MEHNDKLFDYKEICEAIFNHSTEAILIVDAFGKIVHANPSALSAFDYTFQELYSQSIEILVPQKSRGSHKSYMNHYNEDPRPRSMASGMELFGQRKDGSFVPISISLSPAKIKEQTFTIALIIDITELKESREKLNGLNQKLEKKVDDRTRELAVLVNRLEKTNQELIAAEEEVRSALKKEIELNELKSRFVSMASHEFRTPLSTILSSVTLLEKYLERNTFETNGPKHFQRIKSNVRNLTSILNDFLSLDKLQEGKINCKIEEFDLEEMCKTILDELSETFKDGQHVEFIFEGSKKVILDPHLVKNIFLNLLSNAIKYSKENKQIDLHISELKGDNLKIVVRDRGIGIPDEDQEHLFERFFRAKNVTNIQGTGLGLTIVQRYLELMDGEITFKSTYMEGTTFTIVLPRRNQII